MINPHLKIMEAALTDFEGRIQQARDWDRNAEQYRAERQADLTEALPHVIQDLEDAKTKAERALKRLRDAGATAEEESEIEGALARLEDSLSDMRVWMDRGVDE